MTTIIVVLSILLYFIGMIATVVILKRNEKWSFMPESDAALCYLWPIAFVLLFVYLIYKAAESIASAIVKD